MRRAAFVFTIAVITHIFIDIRTSLASRRDNFPTTNSTARHQSNFKSSRQRDDREFQRETLSELNKPSVSTTDGDRRVPLWTIAHMINSLDEVTPALAAGANAIEVDVSFDKRGQPVEAYHGFPCDCGRHCHQREDLIKLVSYLSDLSSGPGTSRLLLVLFDLKLKDLNSSQKKTAGNELARILHMNLYEKYSKQTYKARDPSDQPLRFIISINHASDAILVKSFVDYMQENRLDFMQRQVGFDVGMNDNLGQISNMWDSLNGITANIWQGDGLTNCANIIRGHERLKDAVKIRNLQGHFKKVYYWTADVMYHIRAVLRLGIDAVLTNQPQRVLQVLDEPEFKFRYRSATPFDDPFTQYWISPSASKMSIPTLGEAVETLNNIQNTSVNFVQTIPDGISAVIKKVHSTITSI